MDIEIEKLHAGYRLLAYPHRSLLVTAREMLAIMDYALLHADELRQEAEKYDKSGQTEQGVRDE